MIIVESMTELMTFPVYQEYTVPLSFSSKFQDGAAQLDTKIVKLKTLNVMDTILEIPE